MDDVNVSKLLELQEKIEELGDNIAVVRGCILRHKQILSSNSEALSSLRKNKDVKKFYFLNGAMFVRKNRDKIISILEDNQKALMVEISEMEDKLMGYVRDLEITERGNSDRLLGYDLKPLSKHDLSLIGR